MTEAGTAASAPAATQIVARGLRHEYPGGTKALRGVDLEIGTGLFGLLGPNGAGKSTMMKILCTLLEPSGGSASVGGHDVVRERRAVRSMLGYLPQEFGAWRLHRVGEVLDTLALVSGMRDRARRKARVAEVLEQVGLHEVATRKVKKLSGGMLRRLGVAQALVHEPSVIVVDEPTVGLDPQERLRFRTLMAELARDRTILLSTHIVADLGSGCRDLALIDTGEIVFRGSPADLVAGAAGKVFEMDLPPGGEARLPDGVEVVSRASSGGGVRVRAVAERTRWPEGAVEAREPTLEEGYLAFMVSRGRADVALVEEPA